VPIIQEPYVYRKRIVGLESTGYQLIVGKEDGTESPRTCILASKELQLVPLPQLGTRDTTAAIFEYKEVIDTVSHSINGTISGWRLTDCISISDYRMIGFEMRSDPEDLVLRRNPRSTDWVLYLGNLGSSVRMSNQDERITSIRQCSAINLKSLTSSIYCNYAIG
ncbi:hypothetical protein NQ315_012256, partial [Exocentrus adspersus]